jgi:hypothetical protein
MFQQLRPLAYLLKYIHALSASKTIAKIQRDELLISVFLAMSSILGPILLLRNRWVGGRIFFVNRHLALITQNCALSVS